MVFTWVMNRWSSDPRSTRAPPSSRDAFDEESSPTDDVADPEEEIGGKRAARTIPPAQKTQRSCRDVCCPEEEHLSELQAVTAE